MPRDTDHPGLAAVERLRRLAPALADGDDDARWLAARLDHYLAAAPRGVGLDKALGLDCRPGGSPWWRLAAEAERDRLLRALATSIEGKTHGRAVALQQLLRRYQSTAWPRDPVSNKPTAANERLFRIYVDDPNPPTGIRRLTEILAG
jgi:hypothetical protein